MNVAHMTEVGDFSRKSPEHFKRAYIALAAACLVTMLGIASAVFYWNSNVNLRESVVSSSEKIADAIFYTEVDAISVIQTQDGPDISISPASFDTLDTRLRDMYDPMSIVAVVIYNREGTVVYSSHKSQIGMRDPDVELLDCYQRSTNIYAVDEHQTVIDLLGETRKNIHLATAYIPLRHKDGQMMGVFAVSSDITGIKASYGKKLVESLLFLASAVFLMSMLSLVVINRESAALKAAYDQVAFLASTDPLTGILNRRELFSRAEQLLALMRRAREKQADFDGLGFIMMDLDYFKQVNDRFGHAAGDSLLREFTRVVGGILRPYDLFGRYGGEEFLILLPNTSAADVATIAGRLLEIIRSNNFMAENTPLKLTLSIGATWVGTVGLDTLDRIVNHVDSLMYQAKAQGRDQVVTDVETPDG